MPQPATEYQTTVLGEHLDRLGIGEFRTVTPGLPVADAIRLMHQEGIDCLLVCDDDRLVGIFTDRDAAAKAVDKRLGLYKVHDFMTPDPVVLRSPDTLAVAIHKMAVGDFRHIPVVDGARPDRRRSRRPTSSGTWSARSGDRGLGGRPREGPRSSPTT